MELKILEEKLTVCKVNNVNDLDLKDPLYFIGRTEDGISLVCPTDTVPSRTLTREDGWRGFRIQGTLDFSLIGILSKISGTLADNGIGIFAVSTFDTDYILVKEKDLGRSVEALEDAGYVFV